MGSKRDLERRLEAVAGFSDPRLDLEQYPTPATLAADLVHLADLQGDIASRSVVDLGSGTGVLALGAAFRGPARVVAVERDPAALGVASENEERLDPPVPVDWLQGDATRAPLCPADPVTVLMNPPFGAQRGNVHADRAFLETVAALATVSYSVHNADSRDFVEAFARDNDGDVTHAFAATIPLERQYAHHVEESRELDVEVFRVEWDRGSPPAESRA